MNNVFNAPTKKGFSPRLEILLASQNQNWGHIWFDFSRSIGSQSWNKSFFLGNVKNFIHKDYLLRLNPVFVGVLKPLLARRLGENPFFVGALKTSFIVTVCGDVNSFPWLNCGLAQDQTSFNLIRRTTPSTNAQWGEISIEGEFLFLIAS